MINNNTSEYGDLSAYHSLMRPLVRRLIDGIANSLSLAGSEQFRQLPPVGYAREVDRGDGVQQNGHRYVFGVVTTAEDPPIQMRLELAPIASPTGDIQAMKWDITYENVSRFVLDGSTPSDEHVSRACDAIVAAAKGRRQQAIARGEI